jgi:hypothetical protein
VGDQDRPTLVKVGPWYYRIENWDAAEADDMRRHGDCSKDLKRIRLSTSLDRKHTSFVLLHEILHAVFYEFYMDRGDPEERLVGTMTAGLATVWNDNPKVMLWIAKGLSR